MLGGGFGTWEKRNISAEFEFETRQSLFWLSCPGYPWSYVASNLLVRWLRAVCSRKVPYRVRTYYSSCTDCSRTVSLYSDTVSTFKRGIISEMLFHEMWHNVVSYIGTDVSEELAGPSCLATHRRTKLYRVAPYWTEMSCRSDATHCYVPSIPSGSRHCTAIDVNFTVHYNILIVNQCTLQQEAVCLT